MTSARGGDKLDDVEKGAVGDNSKLLKISINQLLALMSLGASLTDMLQQFYVYI